MRLNSIEGTITIRRRTVNNLRYADDVILIAESMQELQELVNRVVSKSKKAELFLNLDKAKVMKIETDSSSDNSLVINGETVEEINHYNYLGATITTGYDDSKEIRKRISIAKKCSNCFITHVEKQVHFLEGKEATLEYIGLSSSNIWLGILGCETK